MINERKLTERELESREVVLQGLLKNKRNLVKKYGKDAEKVMYGIATKKAKTKIEGMNKDKIKELINQCLTTQADPTSTLQVGEDNDPSGEDLEGDPNEYVVGENVNPELDRLVNGFVRKLADRYDYSLQNAVNAVMLVLRKQNYDGINELEEEAKKLPNGDTYLGRDNKGNHKIKSEGKVTFYNNEEMVYIYGKGWGHKLNEEDGIITTSDPQKAKELSKSGVDVELTEKDSFGGSTEEPNEYKPKDNWRDPNWYKDTFAWANKEQLKVIDDLINKSHKQTVAKMAIKSNFKDVIQKQVDKREGSYTPIEDPGFYLDLSELIKSIVKEKLTKKSSVDTHIKDFQNSDAPQFKGKSKDKKVQMAVASYLSKRNK